MKLPDEVKMLLGYLTDRALNAGIDRVPHPPQRTIKHGDVMTCGIDAYKAINEQDFDDIVERAYRLATNEKRKNNGR